MTQARKVKKVDMVYGEGEELTLGECGGRGNYQSRTNGTPDNETCHHRLRFFIHSAEGRI